jgi:DNA-binding transcriptional LysR family regulator
MVKIIAVETTEAYEMIKNNLLDFAIVNNWECEIPDDIEYHVFSEERLVLLMSRNNPYANKKSILLEEIGNLDILMDNLEPKIYDNFEKICHENKRKINVSFLDTNDPSMEITAVKSGVGVSLMKETTGQYFTSDELVSIPIEPPLYTVVALLYKKKRCLSDSHKQFIDYILAKYH